MFIFFSDIRHRYKILIIRQSLKYEIVDDTVHILNLFFVQALEKDEV